MTFDLSAAEAQPPPDCVELAPGLRVTLRPLTGLLDCRAAAETSAAAADMRAGGAAAARFGLDPGDLSSPNAKAGLSLFARAVILGSLLISEWNVTRAGAPLPVTEANVAAVFNAVPAAQSAFLAHVDDAARRRAEAGEASAVSPFTTSGEAATTAEDAGGSTAPAAEVSLEPRDGTAQASNTPPVTRKRLRPGGRSAATPASGAAAAIAR